MNLIEQSFKEIYPDKELNREISIKYSRKFKPYNANVKHSPFKLQFNLSREWKSVSREIQMGLIQSLLVKVFKGRPNTGYQDLYESFIKNLPKYAVKTKTNPVLEESFNRVNQKYFNNIIEKSNLVWGSDSSTKLGSYEYQSDTIKISSILRDKDQNLLDYIMYHEMLHKKHKFYTKSGRSYHHTTIFRNAEKQFESQEEIEKRLKNLCRNTKIKRIFFPNWQN